MPRLRLIVMLSAGFVAGIAFVLACGNGSNAIDAGSDARAACTTCEPPIKANRYYVVRDSTSTHVPQVGTQAIASNATCTTGDILVGGGCWVLSTTATSPTQTFDDLHYPLAFGPQPPVGTNAAIDNVYVCVYANNDNVNFTVVATAICFHPLP